jgi:glycerol-3-phosphate dehydrogenase
MNRDLLLQQLIDGRQMWDLIVVGGGATGLGIALDAASRGYRVALLEARDFAQQTSSRSSKLIHGGIRYLRHGNLGLVREALVERAYLLRNAPGLVRRLNFFVPAYSLAELAMAWTGLKAYELLAGRHRLGSARLVSARSAAEHFPTLTPHGLCGGVLYEDGHFDDARLAIALLQTAHRQGAVLLNYAPVVQLVKRPSGRVTGVTFLDQETGRSYRVHARVVVNACGPFVDRIRQWDVPGAHPLIQPSQGSHVVLPGDVLASPMAVVIPKTRDGRLLFLIPWYRRLLVGTTEVPLETPAEDPSPRPEEIEYLLEHLNAHLRRPVRREDILSSFSGIRPLVNPKVSAPKDTARLSREHVIRVSRSGLITVAGGKWTTYRRMAEEAVDVALRVGDLPFRPCRTQRLRLEGAGHEVDALLAHPWGMPRAGVEALARAEPQLAAPLDPRLPYQGAQVIWAVRHEMARTVEDVLARRLRALYLDARAAAAAAPGVAQLMAAELQRGADWQHQQVRSFVEVARSHGAAPNGPSEPAPQ